MKKSVYSVKDLNQYIKRMFTSDFLLQNVAVKGEISNCKYHTSGHIYFSLKDESGTIACVMFKQNRQTGLLFRMENGDKVIINGQVSVYERGGSYQIYAREISKEGAGDLHAKFEALKKELSEMGMFEVCYKKPIPTYAFKVGIVTASTGAAIQDIIRVAKERNPYVQLVLYPSLVQGEGAATSISKGIHALNQTDVDVIIVGRGGGSIEDLWAFNEVEVAYAIFHSNKPIVSAVGHEPDITIADYVADLSAPTPSAAAMATVFELHQVQQYLIGIEERLLYQMNKKIQTYRERLLTFHNRLKVQHPSYILLRQKEKLSDIKRRFDLVKTNMLASYKHKLEIMASRLDGVSPIRKLSGGYAYIEGPEEKMIQSIKQVQEGDTLSVFLMDGIIMANVNKIIKKNQ